MAVTLRKYLNNQLKAKGLTAAKAKKNAGKYKSIAAAKKAGSLYYTGKDGKVMAAVYAEDLKKPLKDIKPKKKPLRSSPFPKTRPSSGSIKMEVLIGSVPKSEIIKKIDKGKPMAFSDAAKKKKKKKGKK
tara:strand:+ start:265 stop:654 length:390 start_codon:yes stop_codon:yes gene_type:complete